MTPNNVWSDIELISDPVAQTEASAAARMRAYDDFSERAFTRTQLIGEILDKLSSEYDKVQKPIPTPVLYVLMMVLFDNSGNMKFLTDNMSKIITTLKEYHST